MRISRPQLFMEIANTVAKRATCQRLSVGAVVVVKNRIVSIGYNGVPPGEPHCSGNDCPGRHGCHLTTHAEVNALNYVPREFQEMPKDLYVTDSPCEKCAGLISVSAVERLFYQNLYRVHDHLRRLWEFDGVQVYRVVPGGYVVNVFTEEVVDIP